MPCSVQENKRLFYLSKIVEFTKDLGKINNYEMQEVINKCISTISESLEAEKVSLMMVDETTGELIIKGGIGIPDEIREKVRIRLGTGVAGKVALEGKPFLSQVEKGSTPGTGKGQYKSDIFMSLPINISVPMTIRASVLGVLNIADRSNDTPFDEDDMEFAQTMAGLCSIFIENIMLYQKAVQKERLAAMGQAIAGISHYIKNIITSLNSGSKVFELVVLKNRQYEKIGPLWNVICNGTTRIMGLVQDMLSYSKQREPEYESLAIDSLLQEVINEVKYRMTEKHIELTYGVEYPPEKVDVDPKTIYDSILNILTNAIDAINHEEGKIIVDIKWDEYLDEMVLAIEDNGPGMNETVRAHIFEAFYTTKGSKGTGLGLAITKKAIEEHHGKISIDSEEGKGTTFTIRIPREKVSEAKYDQ